MANTNMGADTARETGMQTQTQVEWRETARDGRRVHEVANVGGVEAATIRTYADDNSVTFFWIVTARAPVGSVTVTDCEHVASLDEARAAAVERATWAAQALARALSPEMRDCAKCEASCAADDLTSDGVCEPCATACICSTCKAGFDEGDLTDVDGDLLCGGCVETRADEDDSCSTCAGTGIGQSGPPDASFCRDCRGGVRRPVRDPDDDDRWRDRDFA